MSDASGSYHSAEASHPAPDGSDASGPYYSAKSSQSTESSDSAEPSDPADPSDSSGSSDPPPRPADLPPNDPVDVSILGTIPPVFDLETFEYAKGVLRAARAGKCKPDLVNGHPTGGCFPTFRDGNPYLEKTLAYQLFIGPQMRGYSIYWNGYRTMLMPPKESQFLIRKSDLWTSRRTIELPQDLTMPNPRFRLPASKVQIVDDEVQRFRQADHDFEGSPYHTELLARLNSFKSTVRVKNIVCMALGTIKGYAEARERSKKAKRVENNQFPNQHTTACFIARNLDRLYAQWDSANYDPISIAAYDVMYDIEDAIALSRLSPPIHVVTDPEHYLLINKNTLVIQFFCPVDVPSMEIIADLNHGTKGPAGIWINTKGLEERPENRQGIMRWGETCTPRVLRMKDTFIPYPMTTNFPRTGFLYDGWWSQTTLFIKDSTVDLNSGDTETHMGSGSAAIAKT